MSGDFSTNLQNALRHDHSADQTRGGSQQQSPAQHKGITRLSNNSVLISVNEANISGLKNRLDRFLVSQFSSRQPAQNNTHISHKLNALDLQPGKTLLVQQTSDGSVSLSASAVGQKVAYATLANGGNTLLAIKPRVLNQKTFMRGLTKIFNRQTTEPSNQPQRVFVDGRYPRQYIDDPSATREIREVRIAAEAAPQAATNGSRQPAEPQIGAPQRQRSTPSADTAPNRNLRTTDPGDAPPAIPRGLTDPPGRTPQRQTEQSPAAPQRPNPSTSTDGIARYNSTPSTNNITEQSPLANAVTTSGVQLGTLTQQVTQLVDRLLLSTHANRLTRSDIDKDFVNLQVTLNDLKDSLTAAKVSLISEASPEAANIRSRIDTLSVEVNSQIEFLNEVYRDTQSQTYLQPSDQYQGDDDQTVAFDNTSNQGARHPEPFDRTALSPRQLADYHQSIRNEISDVYQKTGLYQRKTVYSQYSVDKVVGDALHANKRLFLHKLRNSLITTTTGYENFKNGQTDTVAEANPRDFQRRFQVQQLYTGSKLDRIQGHYRPQHHDLLSNFAWLYAGLKNGDLSKNQRPKAVNLVLANPTNLPENSKLDADKLFRKGDRANGLSALGYELAFLQAAGFKVEGAKLDQSSGLTKIKLTPPAHPINGFETLLQQSAEGFLKQDYQQPVNRELDVAKFLTTAKQDPGWRSLLENL